MYRSFWAADVITLGMPSSTSGLSSTAIIFPPALSILGMSQNMQNENLLSPVVDIRNQSALVMTDVKHNACPHAVYISPTLLYGWEITPSRAFGDSIPSREGRFPL
jgi:hypothetical protein